jgi:sugar/nucleoside kinase (ribokinase family)
MATLDYLYVLSGHPAPDSVQPASEYLAVAGGPAGRGAIAAARLGGTTRLLAACGTGVHAQVLTQLFEAEGIECTWVAYDQTSQHSAVIVARDDATRTIIWLPQPMADGRMLRRLPAFLEGADVVLLDSTDHALADATLDECGRQGVPTVIDTGSGRPWTAGLLDRTDHVIAPEKYVLKATGHPAERAALELWGGSCRAVFGVTQGSRGGVFATGSDPGCLARWDAVTVAGVDSNGAGDTFHGAYAWALARGLPLEECFEVAAWSAALKVTRLGNAGIPTWDELQDARRKSSAAGAAQSARSRPAAR